MYEQYTIFTKFNHKVIEVKDHAGAQCFLNFPTLFTLRIEEKKSWFMIPVGHIVSKIDILYDKYWCTVVCVPKDRLLTGQWTQTLVQINFILNIIENLCLIGNRNLLVCSIIMC